MRILFIILIVLCIALALSTPKLASDRSPLRVFNAEGDKIADLDVLEDNNVEYVSLVDAINLFNGTRRYEPLIGRVTINIMGKNIVLTIGRNLLKIDDEEYVLSTPPIAISGKQLIPVDFLTEILPHVTGKKINLNREKWTLQLSDEPFKKGEDFQPDSQVLPESYQRGFRVIIDPGHGGYDLGTRSRTGLLEKDLTLIIAQMIGSILENEEGVNVYFTRTGDNYISLEDRLSFARKNNGHVYLSIHFNSSPSQRPSGFRIFVNSNRVNLGGSEPEAVTLPASGRETTALRSLDQSKNLAKDIADRLGSIGLSGEHSKEVSLAVMNNLTMPGVLMELLYLSNPQDLTILSSPEFMDSVSRVLCESILAFKAEVER